MVEPTKPALNVLRGDWISSEKWVTFPQTVHARAPEDPDRLCEVRVSRGDLFKAADARRRQPAYQFWSVIAGKAPPVPHHVENADHDLVSLLDAHACFQGICRPVGEDDGLEGVERFVVRHTQHLRQRQGAGGGGKQEVLALGLGHIIASGDVVHRT